MYYNNIPSLSRIVIAAGAAFPTLMVKVSGGSVKASVVTLNRTQSVGFSVVKDSDDVTAK